MIKSITLVLLIDFIISYFVSSISARMILELKAQDVIDLNLEVTEIILERVIDYDDQRIKKLEDIVKSIFSP